MSGLSGLQLNCPQDVQMIEHTACLPKYPQNLEHRAGESKELHRDLQEPAPVPLVADALLSGGTSQDP